MAKQVPTVIEYPGPPLAISGTFDVNDTVIDNNGIVWVCRVGGTPGTWFEGSTGGGGGSVSSVFTRTGAVTAQSGDYTVGQVTGAQAGPLSGDVTTSGSTATLATVGSAAGPLGTAARTPTVTVDAKGRVTALTDQAIAIPESAVTNLVSDLGAKLTGPLTGDVTSSGAATTLQQTANVENVGRAGTLQAQRRHGSSAWDNVANGLQQSTVVAAGMAGTNISSFAITGVINVPPTNPYAFPSPTGPWYCPSPATLRIEHTQSAGGLTYGYIQYTGTTLDTHGNITAFTGCTTLAGASGVITATDQVYSQPFAIVDVVSAADSILQGIGSSIVTTPGTNSATAVPTDWFTQLIAKENRQAGLPDGGRGWKPCFYPLVTGAQWLNLAAGAQIASTSLGPSAVGGGTESVCWNPGALNAVIGDAAQFRRAIVFVQQQASGATFQVSFNNGSTFTSSIASTGGVNNLLMVDSGDLGSCIQRTIQVKQTSSGAAGVAVAGVLYMTTDGTSGVVGFNFGASATQANQWANTYTGWDSVWLDALNPRRIYVGLGVNDLNTGTGGGSRTINQLQTDLTTCVNKIQAACPYSEVVLCAQWHVGNSSSPFNTGISNANWYSQYVSMVQTLAISKNCTFIDMSAWFGDAALWTVASVTTTASGTSATVASGGFPNVEVGMTVIGTVMPPYSNPVKVSSIVGNTINFTGNTAQIAAGTTTLTFTSDTLGITANDGVHYGDAFQSSGGRDAQAAIAKMFWDNISFYKAQAAISPGQGWSLDRAPWVRVSATQFTISDFRNLTSIYAKGVKVTWTESGTVKYGVIASSSFANSLTTVNLIPETTYNGMAATPDPLSSWYSFQNPPGFPTAFSFTPNVTGASPQGSILGFWSVNGLMCQVTADSFSAGTGTATTYTISNLPIATGGNGIALAVGSGQDAGTECLVVASSAGNSTTLTLGKSVSGGAWTASGNRMIRITFQYAI